MIPTQVKELVLSCCGDRRLVPQKTDSEPLCILSLLHRLQLAIRTKSSVPTECWLMYVSLLPGWQMFRSHWQQRFVAPALHWDYHRDADLQTLAHGGSNSRHRHSQHAYSLMQEWLSAGLCISICGWFSDGITLPFPPDVESSSDSRDPLLYASSP